jgi:hypothetical protein
LKHIHLNINTCIQQFHIFAKLSPSYSPSWAKLALVSVHPAPHPPPPGKVSSSYNLSPILTKLENRLNQATPNVYHICIQPIQRNLSLAQPQLVIFPILVPTKINKKLKNRKKLIENSIILTCDTDFALISTDFVRWGCYFT